MTLLTVYLIRKENYLLYKFTYKFLVAEGKTNIFNIAQQRIKLSLEFHQLVKMIDTELMW